MAKRIQDLPAHALGNGMLLLLCSRRWEQAASAALASMDISPTQVLVLTAIQMLSETTTVTQRVLSAAVAHDPMFVSIAVRKLSEMGLVVRTPHHNDARAVSLSLSEKGASVLKKANKALARLEKSFLAKTVSSEKLHKALAPLIIP